ncbi:hypothetical protein ONS95_000040 [Cadophora gregata]|uniref:uncharacterized protein n=1 Tax=Cadophora gregata TaxID=51156 RepID=UPI0026DB648E|nr:uncharacterized protein ONS95_000040 [Cadophora gregata]KAK0115693.1 hypothetical protein ONS96_014138 [Cadophora gregata f. sp. sojae]KAK0128055.1 hypothetical protein ONS95_000040 [Cadophora gregata]
MDNSAYNGRGWTFQERLLSRRCLYFTRDQAFFECQELLCSEDRTPSPNDKRPRNSYLSTAGNSVKRDLIEFGDSFAASKDDRQQLRHSKIIQEYTRKKLSFSDDILNAFAGIGTSLEQLCNWSMVYDLTAQLLDRALLWEQNTETSLSSEKAIILNFQHGPGQLGSVVLITTSGRHQISISFIPHLSSYILKSGLIVKTYHP